MTYLYLGKFYNDINEVQEIIREQLNMEHKGYIPDEWIEETFNTEVEKTPEDF